MMEFVNYISEKHLMSGNTAGALRVAAREVLSAVEPEGWQELDLSTVDVEDFGQRFERAKAGKLKPESMLVYRSRFRNALQMYFEFMKNPGGWRYKAERPASIRKKPAAKVIPAENQTSIDVPAATGGGKAMNVEYPFPLRPGLLVKLNLPADLTRMEAKRLAAYIDALAMDATLALPAHAATNGNGVDKQTTSP